MKYQKNAAGQYVIKGKTYEQLFGSRAQVMHGTAYKTTGELTRDALIQNKHGRIVSRSKYNTGKNKTKNNLLLNGYTAKKGRFGYVKVGTKTHRRGRHRRRGGTTDPSNSPESGLTSPPPSATIPEGVNNSSMANSAAPFSGGGKKKRGGIFLGGSRHRRRTHKRRGGMHALSPADF